MARDRSLRVALVATVLNEAATIDGLLRSIDNQTRQPEEIVIADGGSSDGTFERLREWAEARAGAQVVSAPGSTIAAGRNRAIEQASGDVVAVTDAGVVLDACWLEQLVGPLEDSTSVDVAAGFFVPDGRGTFERTLGAAVLPTAEEVDADRFLPSSRSMAFRRVAWEQTGGYPEWLDYCEDLVFDLALRQAGCVFSWQPRAIVYFRPRSSLRAFFLQYFRYARGDGKADLWRWRHAARYAAYAFAGGALASLNPLALLVAGVGALFYLRRPWTRLLRTHEMTWAERWLGLALIPLIRVTGDLAKMLGYPVGVAWRLRSPLPLGKADRRPEGPRTGEGERPGSEV